MSKDYEVEPPEPSDDELKAMKTMIEEIKPCPFCGSACESYDFHRPMSGIEHEMRGSHPVNDCVLSNLQFVLADWNRRATASEGTWLPIESAPKDGMSMLLGYFNIAKKWRTVRGQYMSQDYINEYWEEPEDGEPGWFETSVEGDDVPNCWPINPTHWRPLPKPPITRAEDELKGGRV